METTVTAKQATCAERVEDQLKSREEDLSAIFEKNNQGDDDYYGELDNFALSIDTTKAIRILLSWGGPSDFLDVLLNVADEIVSVTYTFQDWFDSASQLVEEDSSLYKYAEYILECQNS